MVVKYVLGALAVGLVVWGVAGHFRTSAAKARADDVREMLDSTRVEMERAQAMRHEAIAERMQADSVRQADSAVVATQLAGLRDDLEIMSDSSTALLAKLDMGSLPPPVGNVIRVLQFEAEACRTALELADSLHTLCGERLASRDSTIADLYLEIAEKDTLLHAEIALVETYRGLANPNWLTRIRQALPTMGVAAGIGLAIGIAIAAAGS